jgi:hypothetical protein
MAARYYFCLKPTIQRVGRVVLDGVQGTLINEHS